MRHILTAKNLLSNPIFKFPNCLPFLSTVCCICRQFVGKIFAALPILPHYLEVFITFSAIKVGFEYLLCFPGCCHGTRWHAKRKSYKVLFWRREITPLAVPIFMENACVLLMGVLSTFLVSWLGKDAMAGVGLADSFNMVIMAFFAAIDLGTTVVVAFSLGKRDRRRARVATRQSLVIMTLFAVLLATLLIRLANKLLISSRVMPRQKLKHWR